MRNFLVMGILAACLVPSQGKADLFGFLPSSPCDYDKSHNHSSDNCLKSGGSAGAASGGSGASAGSNAGPNVGVQLSASPPQYFAAVPGARAYYAQISIKSAFDPTFSLLKGDQAQTFLDRLGNLFGTKVTGFAIEIDIVLPNGDKYPTLTPLSAKFDSSTQSWTTSLNLGETTPLAVIYGPSGFKYQFKYVGTNSQNVIVAEKTFDIYQGAAPLLNLVVPGTWAVSTLASKPISDAAKFVDGEASKYFTKAQTASTQEEIRPQGDRWKSRRYTAYTFTGAPIGTIDLSVELRNSLVTGGNLTEVDASGAAPAKYDAGADLRGTLAYYNSSTVLLNKSLIVDHDDILNGMKAPTTVAAFQTNCQKLRDFLFTGGLNLYDTYGFLYEVLSDQSRDLLRQPDYANGSCLADVQQVFTDIGRPLSLLQKTTSCSPGFTASSQFLDAIAGYWIKPDADLGGAAGCLANSIAILDMRGTTTFDFSKLTSRSGATSIDYLRTLVPPSGSHPYGCYGGSMGDDSDPRTVWFIIQTAGNKRYHVELSGDGGNADGPMNKMQIKDATAQEAACAKIKN